MQRPIEIRQYIVAVYFAIVALAIAGCAQLQTQPVETQPAVQFERCELSIPGVVKQIDAQCTDLTVPENRANPSGKQIQIRVSVVPAVSKKPAPDPVFFIPGGPGEAASSSYVVVSTAFDEINQKRDIVLVDQRGTGHSNVLDCALSDSASADTSSLASLKDQVQACLAKLPGDPRFYTTSIAMDDLDQVRQTLGYDQINLYGGSYGTRAALAYMRQYPQHVRAVILDGVAPPDWSLGPDSGGNAQQSLDLIFQRCASEPQCSKTFPNLQQELQTVLQQLQQKSSQVIVNDPITGEPHPVNINTDFFIGTIFNMSYTPETAALIPLLIDTTARWSDYNVLAEQGLAVTGDISEHISQGMRFSILCSEDAPYYPAQPSTTGYLGDSFVKGVQEVCANWPRGEIPADFKQPVKSEAPVLLLSGQADPVTPPSNADRTAQTLPNNLRLVVPGTGHINIYRGCIPKIAAQFIDNGSVKDLSTGCVQDIQPMPFFLNFSGPHP